MSCIKATESYETWLAQRTRTIKADLLLKHQQMSTDIFSFMRATFYRWLELWKETCAELANAPVILAVGDLHVENFGTWRDQEGRLVWGVNDFDEAFDLPYTNDLVRLALSAHLAISVNHLAVRPAEACEAALRAVVAARAGMAHLDAVRQAQGLPPLPFGAALMVGVSLAMLHVEGSRKALGVSGLVLDGVALVGLGTLLSTPMYFVAAIDTLLFDIWLAALAVVELSRNRVSRAVSTPAALVSVGARAQ